MKSQLKIIIPVFVCFLSLFLFNTFRTVPESHHWKDYLLVYINSNELTEDSVIATLEKNGVETVLSKNRLAIPKISEFAPIQAQPHDSYLFTREHFFQTTPSRSWCSMCRKNFLPPCTNLCGSFQPSRTQWQELTAHRRSRGSIRLSCSCSAFSVFFSRTK